MQTCICPSWFHCHSLYLASVKSRLVLPFWYWPIQVVPHKGPLNGCVCDQKFRSLLTVLPNRAPTNLGAPHSERQLFWFFQVTERSGAGVVTCLVRGSDYSYMVWPLVHYPETSIFLASLKSRMVYLSGTSLPWMSWKRDSWTGVFFYMAKWKWKEVKARAHHINLVSNMAPTYTNLVMWMISVSDMPVFDK